jgi:hypothetical protein
MGVGSFPFSYGLLVSNPFGVLFVFVNILAPIAVAVFNALLEFKKMLVGVIVIGASIV